MRKTLLALTAAVAVLGTSAAIAASGGKATGGINHTTVAGFDAHRSFTAQGTPTDAKGQVQTKLVDPATGQVVRQWHGVVDCYQPIDAKTARFSGFVTNSQNGEDVEGDYFRWTVRDNGEGKKAPPDEFAGERFMVKPAAECTVGALPLLEAVNGNIQVHKAK